MHFWQAIHVERYRHLTTKLFLNLLDLDNLYHHFVTQWPSQWVGILLSLSGHSIVSFNHVSR